MGVMFCRWRPGEATRAIDLLQERRDEETPKLTPLTETGSGAVQEKEKALLAEIIAKVNDLLTAS